MSEDNEKPVLVTDDKAIASDSKRHSTDEALICGAATGEGMVVLTPDHLQSIMDGLSERKKEIEESYPRLVEECPYETRLAVTAWVFEKVVDHAREGGTYRYLIYDRLGFGPDAYAPLLWAGGMTISNEFDLSPKAEEAREQGGNQ